MYEDHDVRQLKMDLMNISWLTVSRFDSFILKKLLPNRNELFLSEYDIQKKN